jgi:hypothetical protein
MELAAMPLEKETLEPGSRLTNCQAHRQIDGTWHCPRCHLAWDADEEAPPCQPDREAGARVQALADAFAGRRGRP